MSGHSHWAGIKHKKEIADKKRGKLFSKLARVITVAAREGGGDPAMNPRLRDAIADAKSFNLPKDNIERAVKKGTGELAGEAIETVTYEAFGPQNVPLIIETITDNRNRTLGDIKTILTKHGGKLASEGNARWMFDQKGVMRINREPAEGRSREDIELLAIDAGADDVRWQDSILEIRVNDPRALASLEESLKTAGLVPESSRVEWAAKEEREIRDEKERKTLEALFEALDEHDDVQEIYSNIK